MNIGNTTATIQQQKNRHNTRQKSVSKNTEERNKHT